LFGLLLAFAAAVAFVRYAHHALAGKDLSALLGSRVMVSCLALTLLYALLIPTTAAAWKWLLDTMAQPIAYSKAFGILAMTQFGKYLPGNIAQHIGRVALVHRQGIALPVALVSVAYEMLLTLVASAHLGALTFLWGPPAALASWQITHWRLPLILIITLGAAAALAVAPYAANWLASRRTEVATAIPRLHLNIPTVAKCYGIYIANFLLVGGGLWLVAKALMEPANASPGLLFLTGAFAGSWILGFLAPGAPAGLGIREALLSAWLSGSMPAEQIVVLVVALRIATSLGDLLNFLAGSMLLRHP
jgi:hypothetical protein